MNSKNLALGGISVALSIVILCITLIVPINTISTLTLASCIIPIVILRSNVKTAIIVYLTTSLVSFFILPLNYCLIYILMFGIYGIVKYYIEKLNKLGLEIILKLIYLNIMLVIGYQVINNFIPSFNLKISLLIAWLIAQFGFLIYDYALTIIISYYIRRVKGRDI